VAGYGGLDILRGVDMDVEEGTVNCSRRSDGAGKSTVLKAISGLLNPRAGSVVVGGVDLTHSTPQAICAPESCRFLNATDCSRG